MQFTTSIFALAALATLVTSVLAAPPSAAGGPSARALKSRSYCPPAVTVHTIAPDGTNNICSVSTDGTWTDIEDAGGNPQLAALSISAVTWSFFADVTCSFRGVDSGIAPPVLSNEVETAFGPGLQVGPPQTLLSVSCVC